MRHLTCPPQAEILGVNVKAFTENLQGTAVKPIMERHGLHNYEPDKWYPAPNYFDALNELVQHPDVTSNLVAIGLEIGKITPLPPQMSDPTLPQVLMIWNDLYQALHRNGDVGTIRCEEVNQKHYVTVHTDMYPDDFSYGIAYGFARRFLPRGTSFRVYYDQEIKPRDQDGEGPTIIHIAWD